MTTCKVCLFDLSASFAEVKVIYVCGYPRCEFKSPHLNAVRGHKVKLHRDFVEEKEGEELARYSDQFDLKPFNVSLEKIEPHDFDSEVKVDAKDFSCDFEAEEDFDSESLGDPTEYSLLEVKLEKEETETVEADKSNRKRKGSSERQYPCKTRKLNCDVCDYEVVGRPDKLARHVLDFHSKDSSKSTEKSSSNLLCEDCAYTTLYPESMKLHKKKFHGSFNCEKCGYQTSSRMDLRGHKRTAHRTFCPVCNYPVAHFQSLEEHNLKCPGQIGPGKPDPILYSDASKTNCGLAVKFGSNSFLCTLCGIESNTITFMKKHSNIVHSKYYCELCDFKTPERPALLRHMKYQHELCCKRCKKSFQNGETEENHECSEVDLNIEYLDHQTVKCKLCGYIAITNRNIRFHIKTHHFGKLKFTCDLCQKHFGTNSYLKRHIQSVHEKVKNFFCPKESCDFAA